MIVNDCEGPAHVVPPLLNDGTTVIVAVTGAVPLLIDGKTAMFPVPETPRPIPGSELVQLYAVVPPVFEVVKFMAATFPELHTT